MDCGGQKMLRRILPKKKRRSRSAEPVYLNVYDINSINSYAYWLGLGVFHSGVQVYGVEYAFGAHDNPTTGVFVVEPKRCPGFTFRKSILVGWINMGSEEVLGIIDNISREYAGNTYNLITRNCNHFCNDVCFRLTGKCIPRWVNRLAKFGLLCNCVLPTDVSEAKIKQITFEENAAQEQLPKRKLKFHYQYNSCMAFSNQLSLL